MQHCDNARQNCGVLRCRREVYGSLTIDVNRLKAFGRTIAIYSRRQTVQQIADKITYLKLIFTKRKAGVRCSHDCLVFTRRSAVRCACKVARLSQVRPRDNRANFMSCLTVRGVQEQLKYDNRVFL